MGMMCVEATAAEPDRAHGVCLLRELILRGFKSYKQETVIGPFDAKFSCIVGCNGVGKSVVGDAILFVLGGVARHMRCVKACNVVNEILVARDLNARAEVTLVLSVHDSLHNECFYYDRKEQGAVADYGPVFMWCSPSKVGNPEELQEMNNFECMLSFSKSRDITASDVKALLHKVGINCNATDRFLVRQQQSAAKSHCPQELVKWLDQLVGTNRFLQKIEEQKGILETAEAKMQTVEEQRTILSCKRECLLPSVESWKSFQETWRDFNQRKYRLLNVFLKSITTKRDEFDGHLREAKKALADATFRQEKLNESCTKAQDCLRICTEAYTSQAQDLREIQKERDSLLLLQTRMEVRAAAAEKERVRAKAISRNREKALQEQQKSLVLDAEALLSKLAGKKKALLKHKEEMCEKRQHLQELVQNEIELEAVLLAVREKLKRCQEAEKFQKKQQLALEARDAARKKLKQLTADHTRLCSFLTACETASKNSSHQLQLAQQHLQQTLLYEEEEQDRLRSLRGRLMSLEARLETVSNEGKSSRKALCPVDAAVTALKNTLRGRLLGRLCDVATVSHTAGYVAVNSVLLHVLNLPSTLITVDRSAATEVVAFFSEHKVGIVTCDILGEIKPGFIDKSHVKSWHKLNCPLLSLVSCVPDCESLLLKYCGGWWVVPTREDAVRRVEEELQQDRRMRRQWSYVTANGDLFKKDGEVIPSRWPPPWNFRRYCLPTVGNHDSEGDAIFHSQDFARSRGRKSTLNSEKEEVQKEEEMSGVKTAITETKEQICTCEDQVKKYANEHSQWEAKVLHLQMEERRRGRERMEAEEEKQTLEADIERTEVQVHQLEADLHGLFEAVDNDDSGNSKATGAGEVVRTLKNSQVEMIAADVLQAENAAAVLDAELKGLQREILKVQACMEALKESSTAERSHAYDNELQDNCQGQSKKKGYRRGKMNGSTATCVASKKNSVIQATSEEAELANVSALLKDVSKRADARSLTLEAARKEKEAAEKALKDLRQNIKKNVEMLRSLGEDIEKKEAEAAGLQRRMATVKEAMEESSKALQKCRTALQEDASECQAPASAPGVGHGSGSGSKSQSLLAVSTMKPHAEAIEEGTEAEAVSRIDRGTGEEIESENVDVSEMNEEDQVGGKESREKMPKGKGRRGARRLKGSGPDDSGSDRQCTTESDLEVALQALAQEEEELEALRRSIDYAALETDLECQQAMEHAEEVEREAEAQALQARERKEGLERHRFEELSAVLKQVSAHLSSIFAHLSPGGDACLSFVDDKNLLFSDGVQLLVRPSRQPWAPMRQLSGGQQALASLALSFSLQAVFPSPLYFFDEIDASLDTRHAARVAAYIEEHGTAQYIVVSHRPQVYERARALVGVYCVEPNEASAVTVRNEE